MQATAVPILRIIINGIKELAYYDSEKAQTDATTSYCINDLIECLDIHNIIDWAEEMKKIHLTNDQLRLFSTMSLIKTR